MSAYYGQPIKYFTDEISENQFAVLTECMLEVLSEGKYELGEDSDDVDLESFREIYGNQREVHR